MKQEALLEGTPGAFRIAAVAAGDDCDDETNYRSTKQVIAVNHARRHVPVLDVWRRSSSAVGNTCEKLSLRKRCLSIFLIGSLFYYTNKKFHAWFFFVF